MNKERAWTMMGEIEHTKVGRVYSDLDCKKVIVHSTCLVGMVESLVASFG